MSSGKGKESFFQSLARKLGGGHHGSGRRIYLCEGPNCCTREQGIESWKHLQHRLKERGLTRGPEAVESHRAKCMGVCGEGPVAVVYPEKVWYSEMKSARIDRVIEEHLMKGTPVREFSFEPPPDAREPG